MTTHVFIGVDPQNLDRALKIRKLEPNSKFIIIDEKISIEGELDWSKSSTNMFTLPLKNQNKTLNQDIFLAEMTEDLGPVMAKLDHSEFTDFQVCDTHAFGNIEDCTQIQMCHLQKHYLNQLKEGGNISFVNSNIPAEDLCDVHSVNEINEIVLSSIKKDKNELERQMRQYTQIWEAHHLEEIRNKIERISNQILNLAKQIQLIETIQNDQCLVCHNPKFGC